MTLQIDINVVVPEFLNYVVNVSLHSDSDLPLGSGVQLESQNVRVSNLDTPSTARVNLYRLAAIDYGFLDFFDRSPELTLQNEFPNQIQSRFLREVSGPSR